MGKSSGGWISQKARGVRNSGSVPTQRASTPNSSSAERTYWPKPSSPTFVMRADGWPSRAAATATFVALPPRDLAKVSTSASVAPICSGYRSTLTLPMVMTSGFTRNPVDRLWSTERNAWCSGFPRSRGRERESDRVDWASRLEHTPQVGEAPAYFRGRTVAGIGGQHYVLFQHVPSIVALPIQQVQHAPDVHIAVSQRHVEPVPDRLFIRQRAREYPLCEVSIHVLQVDVTNPRRGRLRQRDGIPASDHRMSRVEAESCVATFQETLHVFGAFDLGSIMWMKHHAEAVSGPNLLDHRKRGEQLVPLVVLQARRLLVALLPCHRS